MKKLGTMTRILALLRVIRAPEIPAEMGPFALFTAMAWIVCPPGKTTEGKIERGSSGEYESRELYPRS